MATIELNPASVVVRFSRAEKIAGLLRDIVVPWDQIAAVSVEPVGLAAPRGLRSPGLGLPGIRLIGTWRGRGHRTAVCVKRDQGAVRLRLKGHRYSDLIIGVDAPSALAEQLRPSALADVETTQSTQSPQANQANQANQTTPA